VRAVRFDHIAIAQPCLADADAILAGQLGGRSTYGATTEAYRFGHWRYAGGGDLEVLEPAGENGFLHRFLAQRGSGIPHVTFTVPDLDEACARARARGYSIVGYDDSDPQWKEAFLHPRQAQGIAVQFAETNSAHRSSDSAGPSITVIGLRLSARSAERAHAQWGEVVRGERADDRDGALVYRWPRSSMRTAIEIDPHRDEGPLCIEYASGRAVALPDGGHPVLGAAFRRLPTG
jgi:methylmalonyl-CoA/ethylmalonyl-CoA epimerase